MTMFAVLDDFPGKTNDEILSLYEDRRRDPNEYWRVEAGQVKALMNGEIWAPVSERLGENEHAVVANQAQINLDQMSRRTVSTQPNNRFRSLHPGQQLADKRKRSKELWTLGVWDKNKIKLQDRKRVRWLQGFGSAPTQIGAPSKSMPDIPKFTLRDPLTTFAGPMDFQDSFTPTDCIYAYRHSFSWVKANYPDKTSVVAYEYAKRNQKLSDDTMFEFVEYIDAEERVIILIGRDLKSVAPMQSATMTTMTVRLDWSENRLGVCPVVAPHLINIDRLRSPYIGNVGMFIMRNKLAALEYIYAERSVFSERYFVEPPNSPNGEIVQLADAKNGILGHTRGGELKDLTMQPNFTGTQMIDRLEEQERVSNSQPAEMTGQSANNIRTAARGEQISSAAIDYTIQETQEILELAKEQEIRLAIKVYKTYINKPVSFYVGNGNVDIGPEDFDTDEVHVFYPAVGSDVNQLVVSGGQRIAQQTMSKQTFVEMDPMVDNPGLELERIQAEELRQAGISQILQPGAMDPIALARMAELVDSDKAPWWKALQQVHNERQQAQASDGAPGEPNGPVEPGAPEAQPGIAPGAAQPTVAAPGESEQNLVQALRSMRAVGSGLKQ